MFSDREIERYARHLVLRDLGGPGQQRLKRASVLVIGAGGIGAAAAPCLVAAGVGRVALVDFDAVSLSNLQRQTLYAEADVGRSKVEVARERLSGLNGDVVVEAIEARADGSNLDALVAGRDAVLDGCDRFETRLLVSDACVRAGVPLVSAAIARWDGRLGVFAGRPCYRCLVAEVPPDEETCQAVGVIGPLAGVVGARAALETVKLLSGAGDPGLGVLEIFEGLSGATRRVRVAADPGCPACGTDRR